MRINQYLEFVGFEGEDTAVVKNTEENETYRFTTEAFLELLAAVNESPRETDIDSVVNTIKIPREMLEKTNRI